jgi:hypothetical protein
MIQAASTGNRIVRKRSLSVGIVTIALVAIAAVCAGALPTFSIDAHVVSAGSSGRAQSPCFRLASTIAEPIAGYSSSVDYALDGGFLTLADTTPGDDVFFDGFEGCTP